LQRPGDAEEAEADDAEDRVGAKAVDDVDASG
jgi:hypothetical protein